jgi:hypothetical protein
VIEMQPGYSRVHVARYTALYTSLATRYEFRLDDPGGQILPFPRDPAPEDFKMNELWQTYGELVCRRGDDTRVSGFSVGSNVTDFVHSEEMEDFGGTVTLHQDSDKVWRVTNATKHPLDDCRAIRSGGSKSIDVAMIGRLEPGATAPVEGELGFAPYPRRGKAPADKPSHGPEPTGELSVKGIVDVALEHQELRDEEICLLARVVDDVPGLTITPEAGQRRQAALLVAHLDPGALPPPEADTKPRNPISDPEAEEPEDK